MDQNSRVAAFVSLGNKIDGLSEEERSLLFSKMRTNNPWFTPAFSSKALNGIRLMLTEEALHEFLSAYEFEPIEKRVGVIAAGNIPAVAFHDVLVVLLSGAHVDLKLSSDDMVLLPYLLELLSTINTSFLSIVRLVPKLNLQELDGVIATGSNNTARYFETYFKSVPHIIRKNRTSCAIISGDETKEDFVKLGSDITNYFGRGCRSITKLFVPKGYDFQVLLDVMLEEYGDLMHHTKFFNNYEYHKAVYLVNGTTHFDTGFVILTPSDKWGAPVSVTYYEEYSSIDDVNVSIETNKDQIQCVVGKGKIPFGNAQCPSILDYADNVDTMQFLINLD